MFDEVLRHRLREMAGTHVRYGYRRLTVLLRREGWHVNAKRIYRLYREEELDCTNETATEDSATTACGNRRSCATESLLEHGFCER